MSGVPKYEIGALLGKGGMAETFEATRIKENGPRFGSPSSKCCRSC